MSEGVLVCGLVVCGCCSRVLVLFVFWPEKCKWQGELVLGWVIHGLLCGCHVFVAARCHSWQQQDGGYGFEQLPRFSFSAAGCCDRFFRGMAKGVW
jgi:hypothetical protein